MAKPSNQPTPKNERRTFILHEVRADGGDDSTPKRWVGHAAVFDTPYDLGWFTERVARGAFTETIQTDDIRALFNHDPNIVLGRNKSGTLKLSEDETGLAIEITPPDTQAARDISILLERGDITQMSIGFNVVEETWEISQDENKSDLRTLKKVKLWDVSPVTYPGSPTTDIAQRSHDQWVDDQKVAAPPISLRMAQQKLLETISR